MNIPTREEILTQFNYCYETGIFTPLGKSKSPRICSLGYVRICVSGNKFLAHRVAWKVATGIDPELDIDHINGIKHDNRIENLRHVSRAQNLQNVFKPRKHNKLQVQGVRFDKSRPGKPYRARITANGKCIDLGRFETLSEADFAYREAKKILHISRADRSIHELDCPIHDVDRIVAYG